MNSDIQKSFVSCIKINGVPILPPLITPELRKNLLEYKEQAIILEQRLKTCKDLKKDTGIHEAQIDSPGTSSQLTLEDNNHIEALNISKTPTQRELKRHNLSRDIIEVTQYDSNGMTAICSNVHLLDKSGSQISREHEKNDLYVSSINEGNILNGTNLGQIESADITQAKTQLGYKEIPKPSTPKPRLIRSNSYTLDSPSPILLAHLKKTYFIDKPVDFPSLESARNWTSLENNHTSFESSDYSSLDTVYHNENCTQNNDTESGVSSKKSVNTINEVKSPTIEVYQTDISVQQITVNTNTIGENGRKSEEKSEHFFSKDPFGVFEPDCELMNVLRDIPELYANQIMDLLKTQHLEQKGRLERYDSLNKTSEDVHLNTDISKSNIEIVREKDMNTETKEKERTITNQNVSDAMKIPDIDNLIDFTSNDNVSIKVDNTENIRPLTTESTADSEKLTRSSTFSMSPSQSLYYSITCDTDTSTTPTPTYPSLKLIDLENEEKEEIEIGVLREKNCYWEGVMKFENEKNLKCSKELFPGIDPVTVEALKRDRAAGIIGAYTKGYLTRRLLKTEKVQGLIATIKDVLVCAVELHHSDDIDEKDVELHRRLINQLSAALYAFHETFFDLSTPEKMLIIAADRHRKIEKLKRTPSGRSSSRSLSNKSMNSSRSNKSMPTSRSSSRHKLTANLLV